MFIVVVIIIYLSLPSDPSALELSVIIIVIMWSKCGFGYTFPNLIVV